MEGTNGPEIDSSTFKTDFVNSTVEKTPFTTIPAQKFFAEWCEINDSIVPQFISRKSWEQRGILGILEKNDQEKQTLFLPSDLHLWEMMDVIKTVDHDTLANSPAKRDERADKIKGLGQIFEKAGLYLSEYLPDFKKNNDGSKQIIQDIANEFYQYGLSLQHKEQRISEIPKESKLSLEDKTKMDEWFLGKDIYQKRISGLGKNPTEKQLEETRKKVLQIYFKALSREGYKADGEKPWETKAGPFQHSQDKTRRQITKSIETPETEMKTAIFRRGVEKLVTEMKSYVLSEQTRLYDVLGIDQLKQELETIRSNGDITQISAKELEIAKKIQKAVSSFPYEKLSNNPSEMIETRFINCVGSSVLGGGLLDKVGIKYLHAGLPGHSATVLITSDKKVYWQDFTPPSGNNFNYIEITSDMLEGNIDLNNLANIPDNGINIVFKKWRMKGNQLKANLSNPETGLQSYILNNTGNILEELGRNEEALEAHKQAISINPIFATPYNGLGSTLDELGRYEEAIEAYKQAISLNPIVAIPYNGLGNTLINLGRNEEAIEAFETFIKLWKGDEHWLDRAKNEIEKLKQKKGI